MTDPFNPTALVIVPLYSVGTYDWDLGAYTPQAGMTIPAFNITQSQLRQAIRELKSLGYSAHRRRDRYGEYDDNDTEVLIERTDGKPPEEILRDWDRSDW